MRALKELKPNAWLTCGSGLSGAASGAATYYIWAACDHAWFAAVVVIAGGLLPALDIYVKRTRADDGAAGDDAEWEQQSPRANPPSIAEWLVALIVPKRRSESVLGDLEERFHRHVETRGLRRARWLYWAEALRSIAPILWAKAKGLGLIAAVAEIWRRTHS
jgi:hypothetical protein